MSLYPEYKKLDLPGISEEVLNYWESDRTFSKSVESRPASKPWVFYEGPPSANGLPGIHHVMARAIKDIFCRFKTLQGFQVKRKAGWDTHGLPVEVEVCKELGIHSKEEIENFGIEPFIQKCQASVWRYMNEWERLNGRVYSDARSAYQIGIWVNRTEKETSVTIAYPDNPIARESVDKYLHAMRAVYLRIADGGSGAGRSDALRHNGCRSELIRAVKG